MRFRNVVFFVLSCFLPALAGDSRTTHPFSVHDLVMFERISDPQVSPDGNKIVFVLRQTDLEANRGRTDLWMVGVDGTGLKRLTSHPSGESNPRWSPCGKAVYFLSSRSGSNQIWKIPLDGGEAEQVTSLPLDVGCFLVSPDGKTLALTMEVFIQSGGPEETKKQLDGIESRKATGRIYDGLFIRHWDTWADGRRSHLFVMPVEGGDAVDVTKGMDADVPSKPFGGPEEIAFTPDSRGLVFTAKDVGREEAWSTDFDLYQVPLDGSSKPVCLTESNQAWDTMPVFSPDGKTLAYLAMSRPRYEADRYRIVLRDWSAGTTRVLAESWDRSPGSITWSSDGSRILAIAPNLGQTSLFGLDVRTGQAGILVRDGDVSSVAQAGSRLVVALNHLRSPTELYSANLDGSDVVAITAVNRERLSGVRMGDFEQFTFKGWKGETVYGLAVKPADFDPAKKYPVAFLIHGGPQGSFGNQFHFRWNPQTYAGAGYAALMIDFHGSTGYGQAFCDAIRGDWGGKPLVDLQKGLEEALKRYPWMDGDKVGALGASYGGYMINWIAGNWPDRFRCLVCHDGNLDERMAYFDTEELWFPEWDHMGMPWNNPAGYEKQNPVNFVKNWKTPMLVVHSALDFRVTETQGFGTFNALQRRGIPSRLLYFPDESHWVLKPANSILWHETVTEWLDRWLKP